MVSTEQFEQALRQAQASALQQHGSGKVGLFGPESMFWQVNREAVLLLGGGAAALLQLAHPFVAQAVRDHSRVQHDVAGRFRRTFVRVLTMAFGDLDSALQAARRVRAIHDRTSGRLDESLGRFAQGSEYAASSEEALLWVLATLIHTGQRVFGQLVRPLSRAEQEQLFSSGRPQALLFGLLPSQLPADWAAFERYYAGMLDSDALVVGAAGRELAEHILTPPNRAMRPFYRFMRAYTASLLPDRLRQAFGLRLGAAERALLAATLPAIRLSLRALPPSARYFPAYLDAQRRLRGVRGEARLSHTLARRALRLLRPSFALRDLFS